jgi:hypothetical protein
LAHPEQHAETDGRILPWGRFASPALEDLFRRDYLRENGRTAAAGFAAAGLVILGLASADYQHHPATATFWRLFACRLALSLGLLLIGAGLYRGLRWQILDWLILGWFGLLAAVDFYVYATRPPEFSATFFMTSTAVILAYTASRTPLVMQAAAAGLISAADVLAIYTIKNFDRGTVRAVLMTLAGANLIGFAIAWNLHHWSRNQFASLRREQRLREDLETALAEVRTLRGIIPICAHCKKIRNDDGFWQRVEVYVREHTQADFSHGICPECAETHFGEFLRKGRS